MLHSLLHLSVYVYLHWVLLSISIVLASFLRLWTRYRHISPPDAHFSIIQHCLHFTWERKSITNSLWPFSVQGKWCFSTYTHSSIYCFLFACFSEPWRRWRGLEMRWDVPWGGLSSLLEIWVQSFAREGEVCLNAEKGRQNKSSHNEGTLLLQRSDTAEERREKERKS